MPVVIVREYGMQGWSAVGPISGCMDAGNSSSALIRAVYSLHLQAILVFVRAFSL